LSDSATTVPPVGATALRTTVQVEVPLPVIEVVAQESRDNTGELPAARTVTAPPVAEPTRLLPTEEEETTFATPTVLELVLDDSVRVTVATTPSGIVVVLTPYKVQM